MKRHVFVLPAIASALFLAGCGALTLNPVTSEPRTVQVVAATKTVTVPEGMAWYDGPRRTHGLRFPPGRYSLEAEDADYWYFRSPAPLELRDSGATGAAGSQHIAGGLMVAKHFNTVPGAAYAESQGSTKILIWKLGQDFLRLEGKYWVKNF